MQNVGSSSLTRDQTRVPCTGSAESQPLDHLGGKSPPRQFCCCSVTQLCLTLCNPMDCSVPGPRPRLPSLIISRISPKFMSIELVVLSNHLILCLLLFLLPSIFPSIKVFFNEFTSCGQSIEASASTSVLPMSIQG